MMGVPRGSHSTSWRAGLRKRHEGTDLSRPRGLTQPRSPDSHLQSRPLLAFYRDRRTTALERFRGARVRHAPCAPNRTCATNRLLAPRIGATKAAFRSNEAAVRFIVSHPQGAPRARTDESESPCYRCFDAVTSALELHLRRQEASLMKIRFLSGVFFLAVFLIPVWGFEDG